VFIQNKQKDERKMSVDYSANFGIGYEVVEKEELCGTEELEEGLLEYLMFNIADGFSYFSIGNDYTCNGLSCFLVVKTPFENGLNLEWAKEKLDKELERLKLESIGNFGLVGGLRVS